MHYRTLIFSDLHIGTKNNLSKLLKFLKHHTFEYIYLNGDIFDSQALLFNGFKWPEEANEFVRILLQKAHKGTQITYTFGNHCMFMEKFKDLSFGNIHIKEYAEHITLSGERILIFHGHQIDIICRYNKFFHILGTKLFSLGTYLSILMNKFKNAFPKIKKLNKYYSFHNIGAIEIEKFEKNACEVAKLKGFTSVCTGHYHHPDIKQIGDVKYYNSGNCVDLCTFLIEKDDGNLHLVCL